MDARDFFYDLDFFIHYPQRTSFDRSVIEAMAVGCPVLLPTVCEPHLRHGCSSTVNRNTSGRPSRSYGETRTHIGARSSRARFCPRKL